MNDKERRAVAHMEWLTKYVEEHGVYPTEDEIRRQHETITIQRSQGVV